MKCKLCNIYFAPLKIASIYRLQLHVKCLFCVLLVLVYLHNEYLCIIFVHLFSASHSAHQSEVLPVRESQREENSLKSSKDALNHQLIRMSVSKEGIGSKLQGQ